MNLVNFALEVNSGAFYMGETRLCTYKEYLYKCIISDKRKFSNIIVHMETKGLRLKINVMA